MWFISLLQLGCTLAQSCQTLLRTAELVAFKHVYTSFSQKPHFLSRNGICCFCVERSCFILPTCLFSFLAWLEPPMFSRRKRNSCRRIWASKKDKEKHWPLFCAIALFSLPVCMSHSRAEACVCTSSVAVWDFLTCLQFFLHTLFFPNKQKNRKKRVTQFGGIPQTYFNLLTRCLKKWHIWQHSCNLWEKVMHVYPWTVHKLSGTIIFFWVILEWYRQTLWSCTFQCHHSHPH